MKKHKHNSNEPKPIIEDPTSVNCAAVGRAVRFSREYVRLIVLGVKTNPEAVIKVQKAIKKLTTK